MKAVTEQHVRFDEWTKARVPVVIGTNSGSASLAFQNWRRFKEAFVPELVERAVDETSVVLGRRVLTCLDPCAGSGTTPLACQFLGIQPVAIEVNPFLADLIEAKLTIVDAGAVARRCGEILRSGWVVDPTSYYAAAPATFVEPGVGGQYLFSREIAERMVNLLAAILETENDAVRRLLRVLLGSAALEVCNATVSGKGRRYRRNWELAMRSPADLDAAFVRAVEGALFDLERYARRRTLTYDLRRGDALTELATIPTIDLAVFSPPYPNSFDYTDVYNIELWALGYLRSRADNESLRKATLRSHVQIKRDFDWHNPVPAVAATVERLRAAKELWNKYIPDMVGAYFDDLATLLRGIRSKMVTGGRVYMVVGDSRYAGIDVPVAAVLRETAPRVGYRAIKAEPFRSMRASPQQGGRPELPETLLTLVAD